MKELRKWTLILTGPQNGCIAKFGDVWAHCPEKFERVDIVEIPKDGQPVAAAVAAIDPDAPTIADYEQVLADHRRLVRELDIQLNGEAGAAKQASLCDIVAQITGEGIRSRNYVPEQVGLF